MKKQIDDNIVIWEKELEKKTSAAEEIKGPMQEKINTQIINVTTQTNHFRSENEKLERDLPQSKKRLEEHRKEIS